MAEATNIKQYLHITKIPLNKRGTNIRLNKRDTKCRTVKLNLEEDFKKPLVVAAIDFGTVHSGFAYSFMGYEDDIKTAHHSAILEQDRVPTVLLLNPDQTFHSFGYEAQRNYHDLSQTDRKEYFYMENFKMEIYSRGRIEREMEITEVSGKPLKAMTVFSLAIKHLKDLALKIILQSKIGLKETDVQWMITIPAISSDSARQFMREATTKAGIPDKQVRLVLEPEAAALHCKPRITLGEIPSGFKYVLADIGGGTSDVCIHETIEDGKLREVYRTTGDTVGGSDVDNCFVNFMENLVGENVWTEFSTTYTSAYVSLLNEFQSKKKLFKSDYDAMTLRMENALLCVIEDKMKKTLKDVIEDSIYAEKLQYLRMEGRLIISREIVEQFFRPSTDGIIDKLKEILEACHDSEIKTILLVGGYSESHYLRERIQSEFSKMRVVLVDDARLAVLNGAVMMGWKPKNIIQRRSRFTYGIPVMEPFIEGEDPERLKVIEDGEVWCMRVFRKMIEKGKIVEYGQTFIFKGYNTAREPERKHNERHQSLYRSTRENPQYCIEEEECSLVGDIVMKPPPEGWPDYWDGETHLIVGETEFTVKDFNLTTGEEYQAQMDFL